MAEDFKLLATQKAQQYGLDPGLVHQLIATESNWNPSAVSPKGARGLFQLMPATAKGLGVDPNNPQENIDGGVRYLKQLMNRFGQPDLALAAYNAGPARVANLMAAHGPTFAAISAHLPEETRNYVPKIIPELATAQPAGIIERARKYLASRYELPPAGAMPGQDVLPWQGGPGLGDLALLGAGGLSGAGFAEPAIAALSPTSLVPPLPGFLQSLLGTIVGNVKRRPYVAFDPMQILLAFSPQLADLMAERTKARGGKDIPPIPRR